MNRARRLALGLVGLHVDSTWSRRDCPGVFGSRYATVSRSMFPSSSSYFFRVLDDFSGPVELISSGPGGLLDSLLLSGVTALPAREPGILVGWRSYWTRRLGDADDWGKHSRNCAELVQDAWMFK